jgi:hypothetical protein
MRRKKAFAIINNHDDCEREKGERMRSLAVRTHIGQRKSGDRRAVGGENMKKTRMPS